MYEASFSLRTRPFPAHPAEGQFLTSFRLDDALERTLAGALAGTGIAAVTGPAGVGKTALCLELARRTIKPWKPVFLSSARFATTGEIWQAVLCALERDFTGLTSYEARLHIVDAARRRAGGGGGLLLIVDEAHLLESHLLEELRVLTAELEGGRPIIRLVLSGQLELEERLALPELAALSQRLASHVLLEPLTRGESRQFVRQQVEAAGGRLEEVFAEDALDLICAAGDGNCRCLNLLCDHTLLLAYVAEERPASAATVQSALDDLKGLPLQWYQPQAEGEAFDSDSDTADLTPSAAEASRDESAGDLDRRAGEPDVSVDADTEWNPSDVAVIEFGTAGTTTDLSMQESWDDSRHELVEASDGALQTEAVDNRDGGECLAFDHDSMRAAAPNADIVETCVEDLYARLDRLMESRQLPPLAAPLPPVSDFHDVPAHAHGGDDPLEADILGQLDQLHEAIEDRLADAPREAPEWTSGDGQDVWPETDGGWDVIEPENDAPHEPAVLELDLPAAAPETLPVHSAERVPEAAMRVVSETAPHDARRTGNAPADRYAGLFTRLRQRRREAAEAMWAGIAQTDS